MPDDAAHAAMRFVVGLGNPDRRYAGTRHNVGFMVLKELRRRADFGRARSKFHSRCWTGGLGGQAAMLVAPQTYMNRSGQAVGAVMAFYKSPPQAVLVVLDDMALPLGRLRARAEGSAGGHKGLADILALVGRQNVPRLRVGIGPPPQGRNAVGHVLDEFGSDEQVAAEQAVARAADAVVDWATKGMTYVMNQYNQDTSGIDPNQDGRRQ